MNSEEKILSFKHSCFSGDLIYAMAGIKAICDDNNHQAMIYQWLDQYGLLYQGAEHPWGGSMMNQFAFDSLRPLIESQSYIRGMEVWKGEKVMIDLDMLRQVKNHMPYGNIVTWLAFVFAEMRPRYWQSWIGVEEEDRNLDGMMIINRTSRYNAPWIDYFHLKKYENRILFMGLEDEHQKFCHDWNLKVPRLGCKNAYEMAVSLKSCRLFIGNQSMCFAIAEAMKVPRLLEVCDFAPNVHPCGENGYYFRVTEPFEYLVDKLMK